jgi:hypothetical protein
VYGTTINKLRIQGKAHEVLTRHVQAMDMNKEINSVGRSGGEHPELE